MSTEPVTDFRIAPAVMVRLIGAYLVVLALVLLLATAAVLAADGSPDVLVVLLGLGVLGLIALAWWLRTRLAVVRLTAGGYRVRMVRGVGADSVRWSEVEEAVAGAPRGIECVIIRLRDGRSSTIPVALLAADKDDFAHAVRRRLEGASR